MKGPTALGPWKAPHHWFGRSQISVAFCRTASAHLTGISKETSQFGTLFMNIFALLRNAHWTACLSILVIVLLSCGITANAQSSQPIFPVASSVVLPAGSNPLFIGDFNGDGKPDLAYTSSNGQSLGIQLSFDSSTPTTVTTALCVAGAAQPSFADVNNDKKLDLVYSCNGFLTVQLGNGDGTFQPPTYFGQLLDDIPSNRGFEWRWIPGYCRTCSRRKRTLSSSRLSESRRCDARNIRVTHAVCGPDGGNWPLWRRL